MILIELEERKQIQMQILDAVDLFCREHGIRYSLACGTLLGAVRHGGYIPWDDDIDIYMLREDYIRFEQVFPEILNGKYRLVSFFRDSNWNNLFSKVCDTRTIIKERILRDHDLGINIDIFPVDDVPDDDESWLVFNTQRRKDFEKTRRSEMRLSANRPIWQNLLILFIILRFSVFNRRKFSSYRNQMIQQFNGLGYSRVFETTSGMRVKKPFPKILFNELAETQFEDRTYLAFKNYGEYLSDTFGNYMELPPLEKRRSFHTYKSYWK